MTDNKIEEVKEMDSSRKDDEMWDADEWQKTSLLDVPDAVKKKYPDCRFRFLDPRTIGKKGYRNWKIVHIEGAQADEIGVLPDAYGKAVDTLVRRGDLILGFMPERLARSREAHYRKMNSPVEFERKTKEALETKLEEHGKTSLFGEIHGQKKKGTKIVDMGRSKK